MKFPEYIPEIAERSSRLPQQPQSSRSARQKFENARAIASIAKRTARVSRLPREKSLVGDERLRTKTVETHISPRADARRPVNRCRWFQYARNVSRVSRSVPIAPYGERATGGLGRVGANSAPSAATFPTRDDRSAYTSLLPVCAVSAQVAALVAHRLHPPSFERQGREQS